MALEVRLFLRPKQLKFFIIVGGGKKPKTGVKGKSRKLKIFQLNTLVLRYKFYRPALSSRTFCDVKIFYYCPAQYRSHGSHDLELQATGTEGLKFFFLWLVTVELYIYRQLLELKNSDHSILRWFIVPYKEWLIWSNWPETQVVELWMLHENCEIFKYWDSILKIPDNMRQKNTNMFNYYKDAVVLPINSNMHRYLARNGLDTLIEIINLKTSKSRKQRYQV